MPAGGPTLVSPTLNNLVYSTNQYIAPYREYEVVTEYHYNDGTLVVPTAYTTGQPLAAGQRQAQEVLQVSAPYSFRLVRFKLVRQGAVPNLPAPQPAPGEVLKDCHVVVPNPVPADDGKNLLYRVAGWYLFAALIPVIPGTDTLIVPTTDALNLDKTTLTSGQFQPLA